jgi:uracil phosphoribosyltransferase
MNNVYPSTHPLVAAKLTLLRNVTTDSKKFRELIREIAAMLAYEATMDLAVGEIDVQTPLMMTKGTTVLERIGLVPVLRLDWGWWKDSGS